MKVYVVLIQRDAQNLTDTPDSFEAKVSGVK